MVPSIDGANEAEDVNEDADHRYLMFSATFNRNCRELARKYLANDHVRVRIGRPGSTHINVDQNVSSLDMVIRPNWVFRPACLN